MITREDIQNLAKLYDAIPATEGPDGKPQLAEGPELDHFRAQQVEAAQVMLSSLADHPQYQDFSLNQLRKVAETVVANMLAMVEVQPKTVEVAKNRKSRRASKSKKRGRK